MKKLACLTVALSTFGAVAAQAQEVRHTTDDNGVTYRETRQVTRHLVTDVTHQEVPRTVYREQAKVEMQDVSRVYQVPVTEYRRESYWRGRWNPFVQPYLAERIVPVTRWESRAETVRLPITTRQLVAETQIDKVPVVTHRYVDGEVVSRVPVSGGASNIAGTTPSGGAVVGGVARLDNDPPRQGIDSSWRPATVR
jgi:hypothetical protein